MTLLAVDITLKAIDLWKPRVTRTGLIVVGVLIAIGLIDEFRRLFGSDMRTFREKMHDLGRSPRKWKRWKEWKRGKVNGTLPLFY